MSRLARLAVTASMLAFVLAAAFEAGLTQAQAPEPFKVPPLTDPAAADHERLQKSADAFAGLPRDKRGVVDWMKALRDGRITPRASLKDDKPMEVLQLDVVMKRTREMPWVKFPHESHTQWLACSNCHDQLFVPKAGANAITMTDVFQGRACGTCHGSVSFTPVFDCERCHSIPHGDVKKWW